MINYQNNCYYRNFSKNTKISNNKTYKYTQNNNANAENILNKRSVFNMSKNQVVVPEARKALDKFKMEAANEVGVNLKEGYNGDLTSRQAGSIGGQMVKKMIEEYESNLK